MSRTNRTVFSLGLARQVGRVLATIVMTSQFAVAAENGSAGITQPITLPAFRPNAPNCGKPPGLVKTLTYVQENEREFLDGVHQGLKAAARDRDLNYQRVIVENDVPAAVRQIEAFRNDKGGALVATSSNPSAVSFSLQQAIWSGVNRAGISGGRLD